MGNLLPKPDDARFNIQVERPPLPCVLTHPTFVQREGYVDHVANHQWPFEEKRIERIFVRLRWAVLNVTKEEEGGKGRQAEIVLLNATLSNGDDDRQLIVRNRENSVSVMFVFDDVEEAQSWRKDIESCMRWEMSMFYTATQLLGRGSYGQVWEARCKATGDIVAIKKFVRHPANIAELSISAFIDHPNVLRARDIMESEGYSFLITERMTADLLHGVRISSEIVVKLRMRHILQGVAYLHKQCILHRDLKSTNILHNINDGLCKVADFGAACRVDENRKEKVPSRPYTTWEYAAPEILDGGNHTPLSDAWACGCILYELISGQIPFFDRNQPELFQRIRARNLPQIAKWKNAHEDIHDLVHQLLQLSTRFMRSGNPKQYEAYIAKEHDLQVELNMAHKEQALQTFHLRIEDVGALSNVRYVLLCGTSQRALDIARQFAEPKVIGEGERYTVLQPVAEVVVASHGIGLGSIDTLLHELYKVLVHGGARNFAMIRIGTCGGIGLPPGTMVLTGRALNGALQPTLDMYVHGKLHRFDAALDDDLRQQLAAGGGNKVVVGDTLCAETFYVAQARGDGAFHVDDAEERRAFISRAYEAGVRNVEMESLPLAAFARRCGVPVAVVCVVLVDRMKHDTSSESEKVLRGYTIAAVRMVTDWVKHKLLEHNEDAGKQRGA